MTASMTHNSRKPTCNGDENSSSYPQKCIFSCECFENGSSICMSLRYQSVSNCSRIQLLMKSTDTSNCLQRAPLFSYTTAVAKHISLSSNTGAISVACSSCQSTPMEYSRRHSNISIKIGKKN